MSTIQFSKYGLYCVPVLLYKTFSPTLFLQQILFPDDISNTLDGVKCIVNPLKKEKKGKKNSVYLGSIGNEDKAALEWQR